MVLNWRLRGNCPVRTLVHVRTTIFVMRVLMMWTGPARAVIIVYLAGARYMIQFS